MNDDQKFDETIRHLNERVRDGGEIHNAIFAFRSGASGADLYPMELDDPEEKALFYSAAASKFLMDKVNHYIVVSQCVATVEDGKRTDAVLVCSVNEQRQRCIMFEIKDGSLSQLFDDSLQFKGPLLNLLPAVETREFYAGLNEKDRSTFDLGITRGLAKLGVRVMGVANGGRYT